MDRLSDLSDDLIHRILGFMPMQDVVKTTVLSKRWKDLWIDIQNLSFQEKGTISPENHKSFADFVNMTLIFRGSIKIIDFSIVPLPENIDKTNLDLWIRYALRNGVKRLFLDIIGCESCYCPPQFMYTCSSVEIMILSSCDISLAQRISWSSLKSLTLTGVYLWREVIQLVLLGCPKLEFLEVTDCIGFNGLNTNSTSLKKLKLDLDMHVDEPEIIVSAPNVTSLQLDGYMYRKWLLVNMSSLVHASSDCFSNFHKIDGFDAHLDSFFEFLESLGHVENLTLGNWCIKVLSIKEKKGLSSRPSKRKCLTLSTNMKQEDLPGILHLLKCSPSLEKLVLHMTPCAEELLYKTKLGRLVDFCNFGGENYLTPRENTVNCLVHHLKTVKIHQFVDQDSVLPLVEFVLREAKVLERMEIIATKEAPSSSGSLFRTSQKLLAIPRSSAGVVVTLLTWNGEVAF